MQFLTPKVFRVVCAVILAFVVVVVILRSPYGVTAYPEFHSPTLAGQGPTAPGSASDGLTSVDWSRFAYVQYVTNTEYLCNSVMLFEALHRLGSRADRLMMYPSSFSVDSDGGSTESALLQKARDAYGVKLAPIEVQHRSGNDATWAESFTKLLAFNQTQYDRVLSLDSDATLLQHLDELFLSPPCPVALPRAYWLDPVDRVMSSQLMLIQPSEFEFNRVMNATSHAKSDDYDMEIVNYLYRDSALILPHRPYDILTGEFRSNDHADYLGNAIERWDPDAVLKEAKYLHFSDWPVPKPWIQASPSDIEDKQPACDANPETGAEDCRAREHWLGFYQDFAARREDVCHLNTSRVKKREVLPSPYEPVF